MLFVQGHWDYCYWNYLRFLVGTVLLLGFFTKRAQFPFSSWLPVAMAAPTPVSALVHSSTLVTAGLYLLFRFYWFLGDGVLLISSLVGLWTLCLASLAGSFEWDSKKIVAYSTLSQLGLMCVFFGWGLVGFGFYHLLIHALFKALMFICVGYCIY